MVTAYHIVLFNYFWIYGSYHTVLYISFWISADHSVLYTNFWHSPLIPEFLPIRGLKTSFWFFPTEYSTLVFLNFCQSLYSTLVSANHSV